MADIWLPGYRRVNLGWRGGPYDSMARPKLGWHTTEGSSVAGARSAFRNYPPHLCYDPVDDEAEQYVPLNRHAYAFAGSESDDEFIVQVEVVGFARTSHAWNDRILRRLGERVVRPIADAVGVPPVVVRHGFRGAGEGIVLASPNSPIRLSPAELRAFSGHLGHQHVPAPDAHWDPGRLPIQKILDYAGDDMALTEHDLDQAARHAVRWISHGDKEENQKYSLETVLRAIADLRELMLDVPNQDTIRQMVREELAGDITLTPTREDPT